MHAIYETDAVERLHQHLGKVVRVTLSNKRQITGTVFTIDPVSRSVAMVEKVSGRLEILMGSAVQSIDVCLEERAADVSRLLPSVGSDPGLSAGAVKGWLLKNRVSVEEGSNGLLIVAGAVTIRPPYNFDMCTGDNELVVDRVRNVLKNMPRDWKPSQN